ncbi:hypothetical protein CY0110_31090 [Crocosphaera chwakensis CCY0110]|uniref:Uncharacterized protein n=1 Tax=Crocosphaera chwakensis CCY0110 TaxID=391612 RepID=A3IYU5_9CHRO|nr:hypothetical protein CY0110_31090 [Crocosphaera chwakensis CCY0110]
MVIFYTEKIGDKMKKHSTSQVSEDTIVFPQTNTLTSSNNSSYSTLLSPLAFLVFYLFIIYLISRFVIYPCFSYLYLNRRLPSWFYDE